MSYLDRCIDWLNTANDVDIAKIESTRAKFARRLKVDTGLTADQKVDIEATIKVLDTFLKDTRAF